MQRYLFAFDLDGTLCHDNGFLTDLTRNNLTKLKLQGHLICFVTGRRDIDLLPLTKDLYLTDYLITNNGGKIFDCHKRVTLKNNLIPEFVSKKIIEFCLKHDYFIYVLKDNFWAVNYLTENVKEYKSYLGAEPNIFRSLEDLEPLSEIEGFTTTIASDKILNFITGNRLEASFVMSDENVMDIMALGVSKEQSLLELKQLLLGEYVTVAVGNYSNDIKMIETADIGVAVNNALDAVKEKADFITNRSNNEDMILDIINFLSL
ncbi:HAD-IIB family hydrolase [Vagococcus elongatus]|uniref:Hydrolase n=1 Tax=Vagococcus elongatus TaxID=180344 RepID=A0A430APC6_9ENTE|nr:HAD-IIB family hydrolase [Vagococcus elongatus]RSU09971.1 hypothetical protein CBF29_10360 [Vagococcus elongatus]